MQLIDRYILKLFLLYLLAGALVFVTLYLTVQAMTFALSHEDVATTVTIRYFLVQVPWIVYQLMPVCCLMSTLFTLSSLNRTNELVALFSIGMSLARIAAPDPGDGGSDLGGRIFCGRPGPAASESEKNYIEYVEIDKRPGLYSTVKTNKIWFRSENILFNIKTLNPQTKTAQDITLYYFDPNWELTQLISASNVEMKDNQWQLKNGLVTLLPKRAAFLSPNHLRPRPSP